jgi:ribosomal protein S18 acetylase RimI-like enzyme
MVRARSDEDLEPLVVLLRAVYLTDGYPANWPNDPRRWLAGSNTIAAWIFEQRGEVLGHLALTAPAPDRAWPEWQQACGVAGERLSVMRRLFVDPNSRRDGVATALVKTAEREAAARGMPLVLDVAADNRAAISFWKRHGWRDVGEASLPPGDEGRPLRLRLLVACASGSS